MINKEFLSKRKLFTYGSGKLKEDFEFVFSFLNIEGNIEESAEEKLDELKKEANTVPIFLIICSRAASDLEEKLNQKGFVKGDDYCLATDLFILLEEGISQAGDKDIYIWGTGAMACRMMDMAKELEIPLDFIKGFIDSNETKTDFYNYKVYRPEQILAKKNIFIWVAVKELYEEIKNVMTVYSLCEYEDYMQVLNFGTVYNMMKKTYFDWPDKNNKFICSSATEFAGVDFDGNINICCGNLIEHPCVGNLFKKDFNSIWMSPMAKIHRLAIKNGTYSFCKYRFCPLFKGKKENDYDEDKHLVDLLDDPIEKKKLFLEGTFDYTCNLFCTSCRNKVLSMVWDEDRDFLINRIQNEIIPVCNRIQFAGNGEVFISKQYQTILKNLNYIPYISILSNGTKIDFDLLDSFRRKCDNLLVKISVDAACEDTYKVIRRGGDFKQLTMNLNKLSEWRKSGLINEFHMNFVVQIDNVTEMEAFYNWGKSLGVDCIWFTTLQNWGTYTDEEFNKISLWDEKLKLKSEYKEYFNKDFFEDSIVHTDWRKEDIF